MPDIRRAHPAMMLTYAGRYFFLLMPPLLRGLLDAAEGKGFARLLSLELLAFLLMSAMAALCWRAVSFWVDNGVLTVRRGIFLRRESVIPLHKISAVTAARTVFLSLTGAARVSIDTEAGGGKKADIELLIHKKDLYLFERCRGGRRPPETPGVPALQKRVSFRMRSRLLAAVSMSNPAAGLLFAAPLVNRLGKLLGESIHGKIYDALGIASGLLAKVIPAAASGLAALLLAGWLFSIGLILFKEGRVTLSATGSRVIVRRGVVSVVRTLGNKHNIYGVVVRRHFYALLRRLYSGSVICAGFSKEKDGSGMQIPCVKQAECYAVIEGIFGFDPEIVPEICPHKKSWPAFFAAPAAIFLLESAVCAALWLFFPGYKSVIMPTLSVFLLLFAARAYVAAYCRRHGGVAFSDGRMVVFEQKKYTATTAHLPYDKIGGITLAQSPFQRGERLCRLRVFMLCEQANGFTAPGLPVEDVLKKLL